MTERSLSDLSSLNSSDILVLGHIICGFSTQHIGSILPGVIFESGVHIGQLKSCPMEQLRAIKTVVITEAAYGPVNTWQSFHVSELGIIIAGLTSEEIQMLSNKTIESIPAFVFSLIPAEVFNNMTLEQILAMSDLQALEATDAQKFGMSIEKEMALLRVMFGDYYDSSLLISRTTTSVPPTTQSTSMQQSTCTTKSTSKSSTEVVESSSRQSKTFVILMTIIGGLFAFVAVITLVKYWIRHNLVRVQPEVYDQIEMIPD